MSKKRLDLQLVGKDRDEVLTPTDVISRGVTVPDELMQKVLSAAETKEKERAEKSGMGGNFMIRVAAVAAVLLAVVTFTPVRGYVAAAAEYVRSWADDLSSVKLKKTKNGFTVHILRTRVANDYLYVALDSRWEGYEYLVSDLMLSGEVYDNNGSKLTFTNDDVCDWLTIGDEIEELWKEDGTFNFKEFDNPWYAEIYIPGLMELMDSYDKTYTCQLHVSATSGHYDYDEEKNDWFWVLSDISDTLDFKFKIDRVESVITAKTYDLDYSCIFDDTKILLKELVAGQTESSLAIEITPPNELVTQLQEYAYGVTVDFGIVLCRVADDGSIPVKRSEDGLYEFANQDDLFYFHNDVVLKAHQEKYEVILSGKDKETIQKTDDRLYKLLATEGNNAKFKVVGCTYFEGDTSYHFSCLDFMTDGHLSPEYHEMDTQTIKRDSNGFWEKQTEVTAEKLSMEALVTQVSNGYDYGADISIEIGNIRYNGKPVYDEKEASKEVRLTVIDYEFTYLINGKRSSETPYEDITFKYVPPYYICVPENDGYAFTYIKYTVKEGDKWKEYVYYDPAYFNLADLKKEAAQAKEKWDAINSAEPFGIVG